VSEGERVGGEAEGYPRDSLPERRSSRACEGVHRRHVLYPNQYVWYVLVSSLDLIMTNTVMNYFGAREVNTIADRAIGVFGFWGLIGLKFATVVLVIGICEFVGMRRPALGKRIAEWAVAISAVPVVVAMVQAIVHHMR
jgi:hypothetical protein